MEKEQMEKAAEIASEEAAVNAYKMTPATFADVHRIVAMEINRAMKNEIEPVLQHIGSLVMILRETLETKEVITKDDFNDAVNRLELSGKIRKTEVKIS